MTVDLASLDRLTARRIGRLPIDPKTGHPVPAFIARVDGGWDFRIVDPRHLRACIRAGLCWVCGEPLGRNVSYVIGPMCAVNRVSAEPPSHHGCAVFSARACPFLSNPNKRRREGRLPVTETTEPAGTMIRRNPGVALVWNTKLPVRVMPVEDGVLFHVGTPESVEWYAEGRPATRAEVMASIDSGIGELQAVAAEDDERLGPPRAGGRTAVQQLADQLASALKLVPTT